MIIGQAVYGDGLNYWSYTHSLYFDQDLDISNQLQHYFSPLSNNTSELPFDSNSETYIEYRYPPFASLLWLPVFAFADIFVLITQPFFHLQRNGFSDVYQISVSLFNISLITLGLYLLCQTLGLFYKNRVIFFSLVLLLFSTNLFYYGSLDVLNSHPTSFFLSSLFVSYFVKHFQNPKVKLVLILGFLSGLLAATRTQDILFLPLSASIIFVKDKFSIRNYVKYLRILFIVFFGFLIGFLPQILHWIIVYGTLIKNAYASSPGSFNLMHPRLLELLFFQKTGIIYYSPLILVSFIGLIDFLRRFKIIGTLFILFVLTEYFLIASWGAWHQGESYGVRMMISSYPVLAFGLASVIEILCRIFKLKYILLLSIFFIIFNFFMILYFQLVTQEPTYISGQKTTSDEDVKKFIRNLAF